MRFALLISILFTTVLRGQISSDDCGNAGQLCPNEWQTVSNSNTTILTCLSCQDDFNFCFTPINTSWFTFNTYGLGGDVNLNIQNIQFDASVVNGNNSINLAVIKTDVNCFSQAYELIHCVTDINTNIAELIPALEPNTTYYVVFSGSQNDITDLEPSEASFDIQLTGIGVARNPASMSIGAESLEICIGQPLTLIADITLCPEFEQLDWYKNGVFWVSTTINSITTDEVVTGDTFYALSSCYVDCPVSVESNAVNITVNDFFVNAGSDVTLLQGESTQLVGSTNAATFFWSPPAGINNPDILNPIASPELTTTYYLTGSNGICEIVDEVTISVISELVIPNVFSPNGDGINDNWEILGTQNFEEIYVLVYDRSGQKVYESVNYNPLKFWNGTFKGKILPTTTYYYVITLNRSSPESQIIKGSVTIIQ